MPSSTQVPAAAAVSEVQLGELIHHVFLTPGHPQSGDDVKLAEEVDTALLSLIHDGLEFFAPRVSGEASRAVGRARDAISFLRVSKNDSGNLDHNQLQQAFTKLSKSNGFFPVHVQAQNAAVVAHRGPNSIIFEFFELAPQNEAVMSTPGRLKRHFLGSAVSIPLSVFDDSDLHFSLADTLAKMGTQEIKEMKAKIRKAGNTQIEERDTTNPAMVTDFLATILSALGEVAKVPVLEKNTREQVSWQNARTPWRRSPIWLLARVTMQSIFTRAGKSSVYKQFMVFLMSLILEAAAFFKLPSEILYCMVAKICGRLKKLGPEAQDCLSGGVGEILASAVSTMEKSWQVIAQTSEPNLIMYAVSKTWQQKDKCSLYPRLDQFIRSIELRTPKATELTFCPLWSQPNFPASSLPKASFNVGESGRFYLLAFEDWVVTSLESWLADNFHHEETPRKLREAIEGYHKFAMGHYDGNPEATSSMVLTIMALWVACDKSACAHHNLLRDFDHEIPREILQSLILPVKRDMERLHQIESHLESRKRHAAKQQNSPIFSTFGNNNSFGVQFFAVSTFHQNLKQQIEAAADLERNRKRAEFRNKQATYETHLGQIRVLEHDIFERINRNGYPYRDHKNSCQRCYHERAAQGISIEIHEWPLPNHTEAAQNVVFELAVPKAFSNWREATAYVLFSVLQCTSEPSIQSSKENSLSSYLPKYYTRHTQKPRFELVSTTKSNRTTHRKMKALKTASEDDVLLNNGLKFHYYDNHLSKWASHSQPNDRLADRCTHKLSAACSSLQPFLSRPHHLPSGKPPNNVISSQHQCPQSLSLEEFRAMAALPCGFRLQWLNILTQLHMPTVNFANHDVLQIILQIIGQAGPPHDAFQRAGHLLPGNEAFTLACIEGLESSLGKIKENWESYHAVSGFIALACRLLSLSSTRNSLDKCLKFLRDCRLVAQAWMTLLQEKVKQSETDDTRTEFLRSTLHVAQICVTSFDVDDKHVQQILASAEDAAILIEASIAAHDASCSVGITQSSARYKCARTLFKACRSLEDEITQRHSDCLDTALQKSWAGYPGEASWTVVPPPYGHWVTTAIKTSEAQMALQVHYNLLTGELLVNGNPLSRLPSAYEQQSMYATLFGKVTLEVLPTDMPGMKFSSKKLYHGHALFFGLGEGSPIDLLLAAKLGTSVFDLIPPRVFEGILPHKFVHDYIHWYDRASKIIEFRDKRSPWAASPEVDWTMRKMEDGWTLENGIQNVLLAVETSTSQYMASLLKPLEVKPYIHVILNMDSNNITVEIPRLQIDFKIEAGSDRLYSRQFRGIYVDRIQSIGTLVGLKSKLVLRNDDNRRKILIPDGEPTWLAAQATNHVEVSIPHGSSRKVHSYDADTLLQRLVDNGSLQSKLVLCHLHALTSHCLPDELTGRTGTEQAMFILRSASLRSFEYLKEADILRLTKIAKLSPGRQFYPKNLQSMETVEWDKKLNFLSQDNAFWSLVQEIFQQAKSTEMFYPEACQLPAPRTHVNAVLGKRHAIRAATFQVYGFGGENHSVDHDAEYKGRDTVTHSTMSTKAFSIAEMMTRKPGSLAETVSPDLVEELWESFRGITRGAAGNLSAKDICYGPQWMEEQDQLLRSFWCQLHRLLMSHSLTLNRFQVMMCLCTMVCSTTARLQPVQCLAAFFSLPNMFIIPPPTAAEYSTSQGRIASRAEIDQMARAHLVDFIDSPEYQLDQLEDETDTDFLERRRDQFEAKQEKVLENFVAVLHAQWICAVPAPNLDGQLYLRGQSAFRTIQALWEDWYKNHCFYEYLTAIVAKLRSCPVTPPRSFSEEVLRATHAQAKPRGAIKDQAMFALTTPKMPHLAETELDLCQSNSESTSKAYRLTTLLRRARDSASSEHSSQIQYVEELETSLAALKQVNSTQNLKLEGNELGDVLSAYLHNCQDNIKGIYEALHTAIHESLQKGLYERPCDAAADGWKIAAAFMSPRTSSSIIIENLVPRRWGLLSSEWQQALLLFGIALTKLQRAERLFQAKTTSDLLRELMNPGYSNWESVARPENLLLEIESSILIRRVQHDIASEMRNPEGEKNAVMQLNMGEGKSSVIVPIVAAHLADGSRLVRVVVGKPQAKELLRTLISKLGGLLGRRIFHMPFNRSHRLKEDQVKSLHRLYRDCMQQGGVLLLQPEQILSFKLMTIEYQSLLGQAKTSAALVSLYDFLDVNSRDIVDESDENFSPKFELIYTMGEQRPIELSPERWTILQRLLDIVVLATPSVQEKFPDGIELTHHSRGRFPRTRVLRVEAGALLIRKIAQKVCSTGFPGLPIGRQNDAVRTAVLEYILEDDVSAESIALVETHTSLFTDTTKRPLLLLRGLLAGRVLLFALGQKRWRVNYGLDSNRTPTTKLAVPYRAKDCPSTRAEFSHPDVVILLTCLSYYYEGLTNEDLCIAFTHLMKSDQADTEYDDWVKGSPELPISFHRLAGVNIKDLKQITENVFPHLRHTKNVIDYFLSHLVFSKELKEFSHKLSASGWDLGAQKCHATTGFSGTNDSRHVLPLDVKQLDIREQLHTNALVLENLLRSENKVHLLRSSGESNRSDTELLLGFVAATDNQVHVILDVGAQVLELTNIQVAKKWLALLPTDQKQEAVVFFNDDDDICVIDRKGAVERLQTSPYCEQLDRCLVFLDQSHTRGTDLRLPEDYRAAVTLGPDLTKDRLAQACMRMRKLGHGQSVIFCVSKEMQSRISMVTGKTQHSQIGVDDVLMWAISETHTDLRRLMPLWAIQGTRFEKQQTVWDSARTGKGLRLTSNHAKSFLEEEAQTIEYRYRPNTNASDDTDLFSSFAQLTITEGQTSSLHSIQGRCDEFGISQFRSAALQEEQEKELAPEIEQERQLERPRAANPQKHTLHPDLSSFVATACMPTNSTAVIPAFLSLKNTSMADWIDLRQFPDDLLVTLDYARPVAATRADSYQRPVQWIITGRSLFGITTAVIISPFEAQGLMPQLARPSSRARLHVYAPRTSLVAAPLDMLQLYTVPGDGWEGLPRQLRLQLNLFAGQLYFSSYQDYADTCNMLGLAWRALPSDGAASGTDGFVAGGDGAKAHKFTKSPAQSIKVLLSSLRRDRQEIDKTHWGRILGGEFLTEAEFEK